MLIRIHTIFKNYPPNDFPKLYPESIKKYKKSAKRYQIMNHLIIGLGLGLILWFYVTPRTGGWDQVIIFWYFMIQFLPNIGLELWTMKYHNAMRLLNQDAQKEAVLQPRRLTDFVSKSLLGTVFVIYVIFVGFIAYVDQFDYTWFGGYLNVLIISGAYLFFGLIIYRAMYGKVKNPHQSYEDRKIDIQTLIRQLLSILIAVTLYAMVQILIKAYGLESFKAISVSLYFHVIGFLSMQWPHLDFINFDVYKNKPGLTK
jgi:MFS family permease